MKTIDKILFVPRAIGLLFIIIYFTIRTGLCLLWCRYFNKSKYYIMKKELDDF